ncbi:DNA-binding transcription factor [Lithospermum erythrorhizon]|uniref:DNA-binding transcription factor n=1 Tax=Lithospermum erythrorhizon TaxID=34254 RepID=A0AAV3RX63_LITER
MEKLNDMEQMSLVDELTQGRELAKLLKNQLGPLASKETCQHLLQKILSSYDKALGYLNLAEELQKDSSPIVGLVEPLESSDGVSPKIGFAKDQSPRDVFKKRKTLPRWSEEVKVCSGTGVEGPLDDGHSWRKYGQKEILGATHPRAYYRCTHKNTRGCLATKQVQKTEKDPLIFEVTYRGKHTCMNVSNYLSPIAPQEETPKDIINNLQQQFEPKQNQKQNIPFMFGQGLKDETEEITAKVVGRIPSFSFPSSSILSENQDIWEELEENNSLSRLISSATSESNYLSGSTCQVLPYLYNIRPDLTNMISTTTSGTNSLFNLDMDPVEVNIEPILSFEDLDYFTLSV